MKLVELKNNRPHEARPYITISQSIVFINTGTTKLLSLRPGMGMLIGQDQNDKTKFFAHFTEIAGAGEYELKKMQSKELSLNCSCAGKAIRDGLLPDKYYLGEFIVEKNADNGEDILLYPLERAEEVTTESNGNT